MPQTIEVRVTGQAECYKGMEWQAETVDFKEYVKGVLPNEWYPTWDEELLKVGAVAVKNYGASVYKSQGFVWDCNWNQIYRPSWRSEATDSSLPARRGTTRGPRSG